MTPTSMVIDLFCNLCILYVFQIEIVLLQTLYAAFAAKDEFDTLEAEFWFAPWLQPASASLQAIINCVQQ